MPENESAVATAPASTAQVPAQARKKPGPKPKQEGFQGPTPTAGSKSPAPPPPAPPAGARRRDKLSGENMTIVLAHGTYCGPGCPDIEARLRDEDAGFEYNIEHPARPGERIVLDKTIAKKMLARESGIRRDWQMGGQRPPRIGSPFETVEQFEARNAAETYIEE